MKLRNDLSGRKFSRLTVIKPSGRTASGATIYLCYCKCGVSKTVRGCDLVSERTTSCGCFKSENTSRIKTTHGLSLSLLYRRYAGMRSRCFNKNVKCYKHYGGRGITICERWMDFRNFAKDMADGFRPELSLERKANNKNYSPENCRWATQKDQCNNSRRNKYITIKGKTKTLSQ